MKSCGILTRVHKSFRSNKFYKINLGIYEIDNDGEEIRDGSWRGSEGEMGEGWERGAYSTCDV